MTFEEKFIRQHVRHIHDSRNRCLRTAWVYGEYLKAARAAGLGAVTRAKFRSAMQEAGHWCYYGMGVDTGWTVWVLVEYVP